MSPKQQITSANKATDKLWHWAVYITKINKLSFSTENPLKTVRYKILIDSSCSQKFYLRQKKTNARLYSKFVLLIKLLPINYQQKNSRKINISFYLDNYILYWGELDLAIKHSFHELLLHMYNSFIKVYYFSCSIITPSFHVTENNEHTTPALEQ